MRYYLSTIEVDCISVISSAPVVGTKVLKTPHAEKWHVLMSIALVDLGVVEMDAAAVAAKAATTGVIKTGDRPRLYCRRLGCSVAGESGSHTDGC